MKHLLICLGAFCIIVFMAVLNIRLFSGDEDTWLCQNGSWVRHGEPLSAAPKNGCGAAKNISLVGKVATSADEILSEVRLAKPLANDIVSSPLEIAGEIKGNWFFEASFPIKLIGEDGGVIAQGVAAAQDDWMTNDFVPFKATLNFNPGASVIGMLVLERDNPSGLPENDKQFGVPVRFGAAEKIVLKVYYGNTEFNPNAADCSLTYGIDREVNKTKLTARAALDELLVGPTDAEKTAGYYTSINPDVKINKLIIDSKGVAKVDFNEQLDFQMGGSCRVLAVRAQIEQTLKQFPTVKSVIISVNGSVDEALQP